MAQRFRTFIEIPWMQNVWLVGIYWGSFDDRRRGPTRHREAGSYKSLCLLLIGQSEARCLVLVHVLASITGCLRPPRAPHPPQARRLFFLLLHRELREEAEEAKKRRGKRRELFGSVFSSDRSELQPPAAHSNTTTTTTMRSSFSMTPALVALFLVALVGPSLVSTYRRVTAISIT